MHEHPSQPLNDRTGNRPMNCEQSVHDFSDSRMSTVLSIALRSLFRSDGLPFGSASPFAAGTPPWRCPNQLARGRSRTYGTAILRWTPDEGVDGVPGERFPAEVWRGRRGGGRVGGGPHVPAVR